MKLYLHAGLYKTASSFLQTLCVRHADTLAQQGIHFPSSRDDARMRAGRITPGNGGPLADLLKQGDREGVSKLLTGWAATAPRQTNGILISAEAAVHPLATAEGRATLTEAGRMAGFDQIKILLYIRDLVDHALSTYRHRAKAGLIPDFTNWISHTYETPRVLAGLLDARAESAFDWTWRGFKRDTAFLANAFFADWLGVKTPSWADLPRVNESVSISEIRVLNRLVKSYPLVMDYFIDALKDLDRAAKADDRMIEASYRSVAASVLAPKQALIDRINEKLPAGESIDLGEAVTQSAIAEPLREALLSEPQIAVILNRIDYFNTWPGRAVLLRRWFRSFLPYQYTKAIARIWR